MGLLPLKATFLTTKGDMVLQVRNQDAIWVLAGISGEGRDAAWLWLKVGSDFLPFFFIRRGCGLFSSSSWYLLGLKELGFDLD